MFDYLKPKNKKYRILSKIIDGKVRYIPQEKEYMLCVIPYWSDIAIYNEKWVEEWVQFDSLKQAQSFLDKKIEYEHFHLYDAKNYGTKIHQYEYHGRDRRKE